MTLFKQLPTLTIIGSGYVGVTSAAIFANAGYTVYVLEINPKRLAAIKEGRSFFYEENLDPLLQNAVQKGMLIATDAYAKAIPQSDIVFSCVGTPDNPDGSSNLQYVLAAAEEAARYAKPDLIYVQKSTVPVGTGNKLEKIFRTQKTAITYVSNPEFLREGTALQDSLWFDRVVVGGSDTGANTRVTDVYRQVVEQRDAIAQLSGVTAPATPPAAQYIATTLGSAELIKVSANAFLALKISFANSIAKLSDAVDADVTEVMDGIGADPRIGRSFLNAGRGYGGGCFPKDVSSLISSGLQHGVNLSIMQSASAENDAMPSYIVEKVLGTLNNESFSGKKVAVLGLSFKAGTSDIRKSPAIRIANILAEKMDANVHAYDPQVFADEASGQLHSSVTLSNTINAALEDAEIAIIATDWKEFKEFPLASYAQLMRGTLIVDAMNCLDPATVTAAGLRYMGVGR